MYPHLYDATDVTGNGGGKANAHGTNDVDEDEDSHFDDGNHNGY